MVQTGLPRIRRERFLADLASAASEEPTGRAVTGFFHCGDKTGRDVRAAEVASADFPTLLEPIDDLPPATMITSVQRVKGQQLVIGVSQDNGDVAAVTVNGAPARILSAHAGVVDWEIAL